MDNNFSEGYILKYGKDNSTIVWITIIIVIIFIGIIIASNYQYKKYLRLDGIVKKVGEDLYVSIYVKKNDVTNVFHKVLRVNDNITNYEIAYVSDEYKIEQDKYIYLNVLLNIKSDYLLIENNIIRLNFELNSTTFTKEVIKFIKKGLME